MCARVKSKKELLKTMHLIVCCFFLITHMAYAYRLQNTYENGKYYVNVHTNRSELPLKFNLSLYSVPFRPYVINNSWHNNATNSTVVNLTYVNTTQVRCDPGQYLSCRTYDIRSNTHYNITVQLPVLQVNIYESSLRFYVNNTLRNTTYFKFFVTYADVFMDAGAEVFQMQSNYFKLTTYDGELPMSYTEQIRIATKPGYRMGIRCTNHLSCSKNSTGTGNITQFSATLNIPAGIALGRHFSYIYLNTSYNKSGNITFEVDLRQTKVDVQSKTVVVNKELENMSTEELMDFWDMIEQASIRRQEELEAANRTTEKVVVRNVTQPFIANVDQLAVAIEEFYKSKDEKMYMDMIDLVNEMRGEQEQMRGNMTMLQSRLSEAEQYRQQMQQEQPQMLSQAVEKKMEEIQQENYVLGKGWMHYVGVGLVSLSIFGAVMFLYKKAWGG